MRRGQLIAWLLMLVAGCSSAAPAATARTLPEPIYTQELPDEPERAPASRRIAVAVEQCTVDGTGGDESPTLVGPGIMLSQEMAVAAGRLRVSYDELRGLYQVDLRTMDREREIYERNLQLSDDEIQRQIQRAERSWLEQNAGVLGLVGGILIGVAVSIGILAAMNGVTGAI